MKRIIYDEYINPARKVIPALYFLYIMAIPLAILFIKLKFKPNLITTLSNISALISYYFILLGDSIFLLRALLLYMLKYRSKLLAFESQSSKDTKYKLNNSLLKLIKRHLFNNIFLIMGQFNIFLIFIFVEAIHIYIFIFILFIIIFNFINELKKMNYVNSKLQDNNLKWN